MAHVFSPPGTQQAFVPPPIIVGGVTPSIDREQPGGLGLVYPWSGGKTQRRTTAMYNPFNIDTDNLVQQYQPPIIFQVPTAQDYTQAVLAGAATFQGSNLSADFPIPEGLTFSAGGGLQVDWTAGRLAYKGGYYNISAGNATTVAGTVQFIYWDLVSPTALQSTDNPATATGADKWVLCLNIDGTPNAATQYRLLHGGLIQAATITAEQLNVVGVDTNGQLDLTEVGNGDLDSIPDGATYARMLAEWKSVGDATKIDGSKIYTGTIVADSIFANTITAEKLNQSAGTEAVVTDAIRDGATTISGSTSASSTVTLTTGTGGTEYTLLSLTVNTEGYAGTVTGQSMLIRTTADFPAYEACELRLYRGAVLLWSTGAIDVGGSAVGFQVSFADVSGLGSVTYYLKAIAITSNGNTITTSGTRALAFTASKGK